MKTEEEILAKITDLDLRIEKTSLLHFPKMAALIAGRAMLRWVLS